MPEIGRTISHYRIIEKLGVGGMGEVFLADDLSLGRKVALKFLSRELQQDPAAHKRLLREAKAVAALDHPHICSVHEVAEVDGQDFIVMEHIKGQTLKDKLLKGPLPMNEALQIASEVAGALEEAHEAGIIHRDLKPANIMWSRKSGAKVMDFGLATHLTRFSASVPEAATATLQTGESSLTDMGVVVGTVPYMSPEQVERKPLDARSDIFSLGAVFYELLTGQRAFQGDTAISTMSAILRDTPQRASKVRPGVPHKLDAILNRCLEKNRDLRYSSAADLHKELTEFQAGLLGRVAGLRALLHTRIALPASLVLAAAIAGAAWFGVQRYRANWARNEALPEIARLSDGEEYFAAFRLAKQAEKYIRGDLKLAELWPKFGQRVDMETVPEGAEIFYKEYSALQEPWVRLGISPLKSVLVPRGYKRWLLRKPGYAEVERASLPAKVVLDEKGSIPPEMARVEGSEIGSTLTGFAPSESIPIGSFLIDKYEATNRDYKRFVDAGAYHNRKYWKHDFVKNGQVLGWEEGVAQFTDATGRPGPSTWKSGMYPQGEDELPVQGVSWYEAAAYAEFAGKTLPSLYHWSLAAGLPDAPEVIPLSNFSNKGLLPVGQSGGLSRSGACDMAGNAREWTWTNAGDLRYLLGGAWNDPTYMFSYPNAQSPFDRSAGNGFRCARYIEKGSALARALGPVPLASIRDYSKLKPVADDVYRIYENQFAYDRGNLDAKDEGTDDSSQYWKRLKLSFSAPYGHERIIAFLFLPKNVQPPYQTLICFPGSDTVTKKSSEKISLGTLLEPIVMSGRAIIQPIYKGTYERNDGLATSWPDETVKYKDYLIKWVMDFSRTIDYLETRPDIDANRLAYVGISWGGRMGAIIPAVEKRLKVNILILGGLASGVARPEVDQLSFVSRVKIPTLMLNGKYDRIEPLETAQQHLYRLLGTPQQQKRPVLYDTGHAVGANAAAEILAWLNRYLGPVK